MTELPETAVRRWAEAAALLAGVGRMPAGLLGWLGPAWSGPAARAYEEWAGLFERATRLAAGGLRDAADSMRTLAVRWPELRFETDLNRVDAGARAITAVPMPGQRGQPRQRGQHGQGGAPGLRGQPCRGAQPGRPGERHEGSDGVGERGSRGEGEEDARHGECAEHAGPMDNTPGQSQPEHKRPEAGGHTDRPGPVGDTSTAGPGSHADHDDATPTVTAPAPAGVSSSRQARVNGWIEQAVEILREHGYRPEQLDSGAIATIIWHESSGNPEAVNNWDANAARGTPATGLMQTIGPTFDQWHLPGHDNILNPVDNIIAGVRYAVHRYGSVSRVPGVLSLAQGGAYRGY